MRGQRQSTDPHHLMERINTELEKRCPEFDFLSTMADTPEAAEKILAEDSLSGIDGYLVYQMNCWNQIVQTIVESGKPVLYADFQYGGSGGFLVYTARFLRNKTANIGFVASTRKDDLVAMTALTQGRPGFISDPVIETASRQIIYAHCAASNRVFGPQSEILVKLIQKVFGPHMIDIQIKSYFKFSMCLLGIPLSQIP